MKWEERERKGKAKEEENIYAIFKLRLVSRLDHTNEQPASDEAPSTVLFLKSIKFEA